MICGANQWNGVNYVSSDDTAAAAAAAAAAATNAVHDAVKDAIAEAAKSSEEASDDAKAAMKQAMKEAGQVAQKAAKDAAHEAASAAAAAAAREASLSAHAVASTAAAAATAAARAQMGGGAAGAPAPGPAPAALLLHMKGTSIVAGQHFDFAKARRVLGQAKLEVLEKDAKEGRCHTKKSTANKTRADQSASVGAPGAKGNAQSRCIELCQGKMDCISVCDEVRMMICGANQWNGVNYVSS